MPLKSSEKNLIKEENDISSILLKLFRWVPVKEMSFFNSPFTLQWLSLA